MTVASARELPHPRDISISTWPWPARPPAGPPPIPVTIPPAIAAFLLLVVAMVRDKRTEGRVHPVYIYGGIAYLAVKLLNWPVSGSAAWYAFAGGILVLSQ